MIDEQWRLAKRILVVRLDNLGDVMVTTPAIHAIKESLPQSRLTLLASPVGAQAASLNPDIDDVIVYQAPWVDPWQTLPQDSDRELRIIQTVRERRFDGAIIFTSFRQSSLPAAYLCYLANIPLRVAASVDGPGSLLTTRHQHPEEEPGRIRHEVIRGLDLVGAIGLTTDEQDLVLQVPDTDSMQAAIVVAGLRRPIAVVHPGCSMPARTYPWEMYAEVCDLLVEHLGATVVLTGTGEEKELTTRIRRRMRRDVALDLAGAVSFGTLCGLIQTADVVVTNNTGPMHIAAAVKTPVVSLFALTNPPEQWGPWRVAHRQLYQDVPCRICYSRICPYEHECLRLVAPSTVVNAVKELLRESAGLPEACDARVGGTR